MRLCVSLVVLATALIASCGGSASTPSTGSSAPTPPVPTNNPPTIGGTPPLQVTEGEAYLFVPTANDVDGDTLSFSIANRPTWTEFDSATGELSGIPQNADIGVTTGIVISATDGSDSASLPPFDLEVTAIRLGSATVSWDIPTTNSDGSNLSDLDGFKVYYGQASGAYSRTRIIDDESSASVLIEDLEAGPWYFVVTAFDHASNESAPSSEVSKVVVP